MFTKFLNFPPFTIGLVVVLAAIAIGIDDAQAVELRRVQSLATHATALATTPRQPHSDSARDLALEHARKTMSSGKGGDMPVPASFEIGTWDNQTRTLVPAAVPGQRNSGAVVGGTARFVSCLSTDRLDLSANAVADRGGPPCMITIDPVASLPVREIRNAKVER